MTQTRVSFSDFAGFDETEGTLTRLLTSLLATFAWSPALAAGSFRRGLIDGGEIDPGDWRGKPVPRADPASLCGLARRSGASRDRHSRSGDRAVTPVLARAMQE
ncbi:MAG: hypothetical protein V4753_11340 [Pseudomonadota bacterium]